jgi:hypothetical protein
MLARQIAIGLGIAVIFPLLVFYGVSTFHPAPKSENYFQALPPLPANATTEQRTERFEKERAQREAFRAASKEFSRILVIVATPLGVAAILVGAYLTIHAIGTGLILGGIAAVACGYWSYWNYLEDWIRFVSLLAAFAILLFVGYRMVAARPRSGVP